MAEAEHLAEHWLAQGCAVGVQLQRDVAGRPSVEELIEFAVGLGMKKEWFQPKSSPHFDLNAEGRQIAVENGAIELSQRDFVAKLRELRANAKELLKLDI